MSWFDRWRRRKQPGADPPRWTSLRDDLVEPFVLTVTSEVLRVFPGEQTETDAMNGTIVLPGRGLRFDLRELADRCRQIDPVDWSPVIASEVERWVPAPVVPESFGDAARLLRVQLKTYGMTPDPDTVSRELAAGLVAELCLDIPGQRTAVRRTTVAEWLRSEAELWALGTANLALPDDVVTDTYELAEPVELAFYGMHGESDFIAAHALRLADLGERVPAHGWLIMVPHRHALWFAPVDQLSQCAAGTLMYSHAAPQLRESMIPISERMYWTDGVEFAAVPRDGVKTGNDLTAAITAMITARHSN